MLKKTKEDLLIALAIIVFIPILFFAMFISIAGMIFDWAAYGRNPLKAGR